MMRFLPWFAGAVVLGACDRVNDPVAPPVAPPSFAVNRYIDQDFRGEFEGAANNCTGDFVPMLIQFSGHVNGLITGGNRLHFELHEIFNGQGVGEPSGLKYNLNESINEVQNYDASDFASQTFTFLDTGHVNAQGSADDLRVHFQQHITINANGEVTAVVDNFVFECK